MRILFRPLLRVRVSHDYYSGQCGDLRFLVPVEAPGD